MSDRILLQAEVTRKGKPAGTFSIVVTEKWNKVESAADRYVRLGLAASLKGLRIAGPMSVQHLDDDERQRA